MSLPAGTCSIVPPDLLLRLAAEGTAEEREAALRTLAIDSGFRLARAELTARLWASSVVDRAKPAPAPDAQPKGPGHHAGKPRRSIYDENHGTEVVLGRLVRSEGAAAVADAAANEAYDGLGATYRFYWEVFGRDSIDGSGLDLLGLVHFGVDYDNAFWDGAGHMVFGDGDGRLLLRLTKSIDVIGHELTHGVTQHDAGLRYSGESGALNESVSDVFGSLVKQYQLHQSAADADWLIGADVVGPSLAPALRSMKAPGTANRYDSQPADMDHYVRTADDNGGVHVNSGIPNKAFCEAALALGGSAWERAGTIWYDALRSPDLSRDATFAQFAALTLEVARRRWGNTGAEATAVAAGWEAVKVKPRHR